MSIIDDFSAMCNAARKLGHPTPQEIAVSQEKWDDLRCQVPPRTEAGNDFFGMKVVLDHSLAPGEWKLVYPGAKQGVTPIGASDLSVNVRQRHP